MCLHLRGEIFWFSSEKWDWQRRKARDFYYRSVFFVSVVRSISCFFANPIILLPRRNFILFTRFGFVLSKQNKSFLFPRSRLMSSVSFANGKKLPHCDAWNEFSAEGDFMEMHEPEWWIQLGMLRYRYLPRRTADWPAAALPRLVPALHASSVLRTDEALCAPHRSANDSSEPADERDGNLGFNYGFVTALIIIVIKFSAQSRLRLFFLLFLMSHFRPSRLVLNWKFKFTSPLLLRVLFRLGKEVDSGDLMKRLMFPSTVKKRVLHGDEARI